MSERILHAAIRDKGEVYFLPRPARHGDIFKAHANVVNGVISGGIVGGEQGFVTNEARSVDRYEAWKIAKAADQVIDQPDGYKRLGPQLFTEDLW